MSNDPKSHDWARNTGRAILGIDPERRRNTENGGDRRSRPALQPEVSPSTDRGGVVAERDASPGVGGGRHD